MLPKALWATMAALMLGGCLGPGVAPAVTGSVSPAVGGVDPAKRPNGSERALADAVTACLDLGLPVMTPAFRRCVTDKQALMPVSALQ